MDANILQWFGIGDTPELVDTNIVSTGGRNLPLVKLRPPIEYIKGVCSGFDCPRTIGISPTDKILDNGERRITAMIDEILRSFNKRKHTIDYVIVPEWSPIQERLHYHGWIQITKFSQIARIKRAIQTVIGRCEFRVVNSKIACTPDYMFKSYEVNSCTETKPYYKEHQRRFHHRYVIINDALVEKLASYGETNFV